MATGSLSLPLGDAVQDSSVAGALMFVQSTASAPSPAFYEMVNRSGIGYHVYTWAFRMPVDYASGLVCKVQWKTLDTNGAHRMVWNCRIAAITPGDAETPDEKAVGANNSVSTAPNATEARRLVESSCTMTNADSLAAGDWVELNIRADVDVLSGTLNQNAELVAVTLEYTTT